MSTQLLWARMPGEAVVTRVVISVEQARWALGYLRGHPGPHVFGMDTEHYSLFGGRDPETPQDLRNLVQRIGAHRPAGMRLCNGPFLHLLQLCTPDGFAFVFDMVALGDLMPEMKAFLTDPREWQVVMAGGSEYEAFRNTFGGTNWDVTMKAAYGYVDVQAFGRWSLLKHVAAVFPLACTRMVGEAKAADREDFTSGTALCRKLVDVLQPGHTVEKDKGLRFRRPKWKWDRHMLYSSRDAILNVDVCFGEVMFNDQAAQWPVGSPDILSMSIRRIYQQVPSVHRCRHYDEPWHVGLLQSWQKCASGLVPAPPGIGQPVVTRFTGHHRGGILLLATEETKPRVCTLQDVRQEALGLQWHGLREGEGQELVRMKSEQLARQQGQGAADRIVDMTDDMVKILWYKAAVGDQEFAVNLKMYLLCSWVDTDGHLKLLLNRGKIDETLTAANAAAWGRRVWDLGVPTTERPWSVKNWMDAPAHLPPTSKHRLMVVQRHFEDALTALLHYINDAFVRAGRAAGTRTSEALRQRQLIWTDALEIRDVEQWRKRVKKDFATWTSAGLSRAQKMYEERDQPDPMGLMCLHSLASHELARFYWD